MAVKIEPCKGCGTPVWLMVDMGVTVKADLNPLDASAAAYALLGGRELWTLRLTQDGRPYSLLGASPAILGGLNGPTPPTVLGQHQCLKAQEAASRPFGQGVRPSLQETPPSPPVGRAAPFSGPSRGTSSVRVAERPRTRACDECSRPVIIDGPELYTAIELGATVIWAVHDNCDERQ